MYHVTTRALDQGESNRGQLSASGPGHGQHHCTTAPAARTKPAQFHAPKAFLNKAAKAAQRLFNKAANLGTEFDAP